MNQQRRSPDEPSAARTLDEEGQRDEGGVPLESGFAPRDPERAEADSQSSESDGEPDSLYERLLRSGALDEVMEVAAREQEEASKPLEAESEIGRGPDSEVVPAGTAAAAEADADALDLEIDLAPADPTPAALGDDDPTPTHLPHNARSPELPSVMLGPGAAPRKDSTDRVVLRAEREARQRPSLTPAAAKPARQPARDGRPMLALVALLFVTAGALLFWVITRPDPRPASPDTAASRPEPAEPSAQATPSPEPVAPPAPNVEPEPAEPAEVTESEEATVTEKVPDRRRRAARRPRADAPAAPAASPEPAEPTQPALPDKPSRDAVVGTMQALLPALEVCAAGAHGDVRLLMSVRGSGKVSHVEVQGHFEGTPAGSCMARAVRGAHFEEFSSNLVRLTYPVRL